MLFFCWLSKREKDLQHLYFHDFLCILVNPFLLPTWYIVAGDWIWCCGCFRGLFKQSFIRYCNSIDVLDCPSEAVITFSTDLRVCYSFDDFYPFHLSFLQTWVRCFWPAWMKFVGYTIFECLYSLIVIWGVHIRLSQSNNLLILIMTCYDFGSHPSIWFVHQLCVMIIVHSFCFPYRKSASILNLYLYERTQSTSSLPE